MPADLARRSVVSRERGSVRLMDPCSCGFWELPIQHLADKLVTEPERLTFADQDTSFHECVEQRRQIVSHPAREQRPQLVEPEWIAHDAGSLRNAPLPTVELAEMGREQGVQRDRHLDTAVWRTVTRPEMVCSKFLQEEGAPCRHVGERTARDLVVDEVDEELIRLV